MYLLAHHVFDALGYRRYEWKCDSLNEPSRVAAARLGFTYEGRFRNAMVYKGRNRDTDWFSITDAEWPRIRAAHEAWLDPANFDESGVQLQRLGDLTARDLRRAVGRWFAGWKPRQPQAAVSLAPFAGWKPCLAHRRPAPTPGSGEPGTVCRLETVPSSPPARGNPRLTAPQAHDPDPGCPTVVAESATWLVTPRP